MKILFCVCSFITIVTVSTSSPVKDYFDWNTIIHDNTLPSDEFILKNITPKREGRITGGDEVIPNSLPYQIALSLRKTSGITTLCGGTLISDRVILSAAHCLHETRFGFASFGAHNLRKQSLRIQIEAENFIIHPEFNITTLNNDVGLIKLAEPVLLNEKIQVIKLSKDGKENDYTDTRVMASGWGKYNDDTMFTSNILRFVNLVVLNQKECLKFYNGAVIKNFHLCTNGSSGKSTCSGDSGGPLVIINEQNEKVQIGISSFGSKTGCEKGYPAVFTRITSFLDWINKNSKI